MALRNSNDQGPAHQLRFADDRLFFWSAFLPTALIVFTLILFPLLFTLYVSLFQRNLLGGTPQFLALGNYAAALRDPLFWQSFTNGLI